MSAKARGIILSGDGAELIVQATDADVRRFGQGDVVDVLRRVQAQAPSPIAAYGSWVFPDSMSLISSSITSYLSSPSFHDCAVAYAAAANGNAILRTACGCERRQAVPQPPPSVVRVPLSMPGVSFADQASLSNPSPTSVNVREFVFSHEERHGRRRHPVYVERTT